MERRAIVGWVDAETRRRVILVWPGCTESCRCGSYQPQKKKTREKENPEAREVGVCEGDIREYGVCKGVVLEGGDPDGQMMGPEV